MLNRERKKLPLLVAVSVALLSGCATTGEPLEKTIPNGAAVARAVVLCKTNVAELREQLGTPSRDGRLGTQSIATWVTEWDPLTRYLGVLLDKNGTVVDLYWDVPSEVTWAPTNRCTGK